MRRIAIQTTTAGLLVAALLPSRALSPQERTATDTLTPPALLQGPTAAMLRAHMKFLSHDQLNGRAPGTRGGAIAAQYIASQFEVLGLSPGVGDTAFLQRVPLLGARPDPSLVVGIGRRTTTLRHLEDFVAWPVQGDSSVIVDGEIVFAGYGIEAAEWKWDDYGGSPLVGKIVIVLAGDPGVSHATRFRGDTLTYYGTWRYKVEQAARMGAQGVLVVHDPGRVPYTWPAVQATWSGEHVGPAHSAPQTLRFGAWISREAAARLVQETGRDLDLLVRRAQQEGFRPIPLDAHVVLHMRSRIRRFDGTNVIARLPGREQTGRETVVLLAHYDHLGTGAPQQGDSIYNGAVDNASGIAALLAAAAGLAEADQPLRRSVLFVATTASEPGNAGAGAYISAPPWPLEWTTAVINLDRGNVWGATLDAVALGADRSTLGSVFAQAAAGEGLEPGRDPSPELGWFFRSDHFPFAQAGVPVLDLRPGIRFPDHPVDWWAKQDSAYLAERFHRPSDEWRNEFSYAGLLQQVRLMIRIAWQLGTASTFPSWHPGTDYRPAGERLRLRRTRGEPGR